MLLVLALVLVLVTSSDSSLGCKHRIEGIERVYRVYKAGTIDVREQKIMMWERRQSPGV